MEELFDILQNKTLAEITIPGTHDSGSFNMTSNLINIPKKFSPLITLIKSTTKLSEQIIGWSKAQQQPYINQLSAGYRYLDIRICYVDVDVDYFGETADFKSGWYIDHGIAVGIEISSFFDELKLFLKENPKEVIVVEVQHTATKNSHNEDNLEKFNNMLEKEIGEYLLEPEKVLKEENKSKNSKNQQNEENDEIWSNPNKIDVEFKISTPKQKLPNSQPLTSLPTIGEMVKSNKRVIMTINDGKFNEDKYWNEKLIAGMAGLAKNSEQEQEQVKKAEKQKQVKNQSNIRSKYWTDVLLKNSFTNSPYLETMLEFNKKVIKGYNKLKVDPEKTYLKHLYKMSWTLTPNIPSVLKSLLPFNPFNEPTDLLKLSKKANKAFKQWHKEVTSMNISTSTGSKVTYPIFGNIFKIDNYETCEEFVDLVVGDLYEAFKGIKGVKGERKN